MCILLKPIQYNTIWVYTFDFTNRRWVLGPLSILVGIALIWTELRKRGRGSNAPPRDPGDSP